MDWTRIIKEHKGEWVALKEDRVTVISAAKEGVDAYNEARKQGYEKPLMLKVPEKVKNFAGHSFTI